MLQIHLSKNAAKLLRNHLESPFEVDASALQWYAHLTDVGGEDCIVLMELQSRYAMVFCGNSIGDEDHFPDTVQDRLWREVCVITQLEDRLEDEDLALLSDIALDISSSQQFQRGSDMSVMAHINQVVDQLRFMVEVEGYPLPDNGADAVSFGLSANDMYRKRKGDKDYFVPLEVFRDFWLGLINVVKERGEKPPTRIQFEDDNDQESGAEQTGSVKNNVISVDFKQRRVNKGD